MIRQVEDIEPGMGCVYGAIALLVSYIGVLIALIVIGISKGW